MKTLETMTGAKLKALLASKPGLTHSYFKALKKAKALVATNGKPGWLTTFQALNSAGEFCRAMDAATGVVHTAARREEAFKTFRALALENVAQPMTLPPSGTHEMPSSLKTTVRVTGLATSFSKAEFVYVVSTIHRKELGGFYQTSILKYTLAEWEAGPHRAQPQTVYRVEVMSQLQSAQEHVDTVRMALAKDEDAWLGTKAYQDDVMNALSGANQRNNCPQEMSWTDQRIRNVVLAANINYKRGSFDRLFSS